MSKKCHFLSAEFPEGQTNTERDFIAEKYSYGIQQIPQNPRKAMTAPIGIVAGLARSPVEARENSLEPHPLDQGLQHSSHLHHHLTIHGRATNLTPVSRWRG
jgi:hypothetical protein